MPTLDERRMIDRYITRDHFDRVFPEEGDFDMNFSDALAMIKAGKLVSRAGWNGKGMFIFLVNGSTFKVNRPPLMGIFPEGTEIRYHGHIDMKTADGMVVPWLCSQTDMLAEDWGIVPDATT